MIVLEVNETLTDAAIADEVNFQFMPMPDGVEPSCTKTSDICLCNKIEACVVSRMGCVDGCTGEDATALANFVSCFEANDPENQCGDSTKGKDCAVAAGLPASELTDCLNTPAEYEQVQAGIQQAAQLANIQATPTILVDGKPCTNMQTSGIEQCLCDAGVGGACH